MCVLVLWGWAEVSKFEWSIYKDQFTNPVLYVFKLNEAMRYFITIHYEPLFAIVLLFHFCQFS